MKVDFMIVGAQKCGTTTLFDILSTHPALVGSSRKEPGFFSATSDWRKNLAWYEKFYTQREGALYFEASTDYTYYPSRNLRIWDDLYEYNPKMKFIYLVRHPIERIVSSYVHTYETGYTDLGLEEALVKDPFFINATRYYTQINPYIKKFGRENVLVIDFADLVRNKDVVVRDVADFLGVDYAEFGEYKDVRSNVSIEMKRHHHKYDTPVAMKVLRRLLPPLWKALTRNSTRRFSEKPTMSLEHQQMVINMLDLDIRALQQLMNKDLSDWLTLEKSPRYRAVNARETRLEAREV